MIITIDPITGKRINAICVNLMRESDWLHRYERPGRWHGAGAKAIGLKGSVRQAALGAMLQGLTPDGKVRLADDALDPMRQGGWLLNFKSPPTVNPLHAVAPVGFVREVEISHETAVKAGLEVIEKEVNTKEGTSQVFAVFQHRVGYAQTPDLHTQVAAVGLGFLSNGHVQTITREAMESSRKSAEQVYLRAYAHQLEKRLGLQVKMDAHSFQVVGVPEHACKMFAQEFGTNRGRGLELFECWRTPARTYRSELRDRWNDLGSKAGWTTDQAKDLVNYARAHHTQTSHTTDTSKTQSQQQTQSH